jgi:predicted metal-dependent hydrolase
VTERRQRMDEGRAAFNRGEFYEAHESWEEVWDEIDDPERRWVQGMIQIATGLHKLQRFRSDVCLTLLRKALGKLEGAPDALDGIDLAQMRRDAERVAAAIERGERPDAATVKLQAR